MTTAFTDHTPLSLKVRGATLRYGAGMVFDSLDVTVEGGLWTCILGPSGVGKSSLLKLVASLLPGVATGTITAGDGRPLSGRIAYMAQDDLLLPWLSVIDNVVLGDRLRGRRPDRDRARALLQRVGLGSAVEARPAALSGGMRQRTALARTLMENRPVVLMDEPFAALDAITRFRLQALAAGMLAGRTVLLITHDPFEALRLGHRVLVMTGRPARLEEVLRLTTPMPRDPAAPDLAKQHAAMLERLAAASGDTP